MIVTLTRACRLSAEDHALQCTKQMTVKCPSSFQFRTNFCRRAKRKFHIFRNSDVRTERGRPLPFGRSVTPAELMFFSSRSTLVQTQFFPENILNKRCELQFFSWRKTLISARSLFTELSYTQKNHLKIRQNSFVIMAIVFCYFKINSKKLWGYVKNKIALICAKCCVDLINSSKVTSRKTIKWPRFLSHPVDKIKHVKLNLSATFLFYVYDANNTGLKIQKRSLALGSLIWALKRCDFLRDSDRIVQHRNRISQDTATNDLRQSDHV